MPSDLPIPIKIAPAVTLKPATQITKPQSPIKVEPTGDVVMSIGERAKLRKEMSVDPLSSSLVQKSVSSTTKESSQPLRKSPRKQMKVENQTPT